jgi:hypothetical protein
MGKTLGKTYGIKVGYYSKHLGKDIGNNRKSNNPNASPSPKEKKPWVSWVHVSLIHWLSKIFYFYICFSPFSTKSNGRKREYGCILGLCF